MVDPPTATLTLDLAWIGDQWEVFEHQPSKLAEDGSADWNELLDKVDASRFRKAWREMMEADECNPT